MWRNIGEASTIKDLGSSPRLGFVDLNLTSPRIFNGCSATQMLFILLSIPD